MPTCSQKQLIIELQTRKTKFNRTTHIVNLTIKDNHEEAQRGADLCLSFCKRVSNRI